MTILLVPPTGTAGSNVVFLCLPFFWVLSCADPRWFHFIYLSSFLRLITRSLTEIVVWRGWVTSMLRLFRISRGQAAGHSWRTQNGDGSQGSKVPDGLAGRTWLCYSYHELLPLPGGCFELRFLVLLCLQVLIVVFFSFFSHLVFFKCLPHPALQRGARQFFFIFFLFRFVFLVFVSLFFLCFLSFLFSKENNM